jgi:hypothetical protein
VRITGDNARMNAIRSASALLLLSLSLLLPRCTASAVQRAPEAGGLDNIGEKTIEVTVLNAAFGAQDRSVGQPVIVRVRSRSGRVLREVETDRQGHARLSDSWPDDDPPVQIEAVMDDRESRYPTGIFGGAIVSVDARVSSYCITLPSACVF